MIKKRRLLLTDTTLRDGEQRPGTVFDAQQKCRLALLLDRDGIHQIDAGIPAIGTSEQTVICRIIENRVRARISVWNRLNPQDILASMACQPDIIHISVPSSYVHIYSKLNKNKTWLISQMEQCVILARERGFTVTIGFEDASRADMTFLIYLTQRLKALGVSRVQFADTVGILTPGRAYDCVEALTRLGGLPVSFHGHNDLGFAVANALASAAAGAEAVEATLFGLGERAGNCDLAALIQAAAPAYELRPALRDCAALQRHALEIIRS
ncbi:MAG: homocitrate synthase [Oscillospiraceae bacterium]|nr:homocitrate synthase [Oscillospiraceae bacterium]MDD4367832.1 homocitrate synthase [Oscillospiraceae bacterium]